MLLLLMMCGQSGSRKDAVVYKPNNPFMEVRNSRTVALAWTPPEENKDSIESYELWYKTNNNQIYNLLKNVTASDSPSVVLNRDSIPDPDSIFYFRIRTVMKNGSKSGYHYTTDTNAVPRDGWFLLWN